MIIYQSEQVHPYVYQGTHKETGKIYIGSRTTKDLKLPSHLDFPNYKTSAPEIESTFNEFDWIIVAEFFDPDDAYDHEQLLIWEQWQISKPNSLNKVCFHLKKAFNSIGLIHSTESLEKIKNAGIRPCKESTKIKIGLANSAKVRTELEKEHLRNIMTGRPSKNKGSLRTETQKENISKSLLRRKLSAEHKENIKLGLVGLIRSKEQYIKSSKTHTKYFDFLTPDGFLLEHITMNEFCENFNIKYSNSTNYFCSNKPYKGFIRF